MHLEETHSDRIFHDLESLRAHVAAAADDIRVMLERMETLYCKYDAQGHAVVDLKCMRDPTYPFLVAQQCKYLKVSLISSIVVLSRIIAKVSAKPFPPRQSQIRTLSKMCATGHLHQKHTLGSCFVRIYLKVHVHEIGLYLGLSSHQVQIYFNASSAAYSEH